MGGNSGFMNRLHQKIVIKDIYKSKDLYWSSTIRGYQQKIQGNVCTGVDCHARAKLNCISIFRRNDFYILT